MQLFQVSFSTVVAFVVMALAFGMPVRAAGPEVVVSIPPIHSLVSGVMKGVGSPDLLIGGGKSPHTFSLRPSDARALNQADLIFWVGEGIESFLVKTLRSLDGDATIVELASIPELDLLPAREGDAWSSHVHEYAAHEKDEHDHHSVGKKESDLQKDEDHHEQTTHHDGHGHAEQEMDPHIWLSTDNAKAIVAAIVSALAEADPDHSAQYRANGQLLEEKIDAMRIVLAEKLNPISGKGFIVFHDSFQYFEKEFGLNAVGSISISPDRLSGARRLGELRDRIERFDALCVFKEPQFTPKLAEAIVEGTSARLGTLDPVGADLKPGQELYFNLMRFNTRSLVSCLAANGGG